ncbi:response regulator transcription factor [Kribbella alba]|uniref:Response regulator transcription factor n=2 Tax=Kribbella alba TaxID=190197 RepID=A0ABN2G002_9ACTN
MTSVMIVDDQEMIRIGLRAILEAQEDIRVVAEAGDGLRAVELVARDPVDVVLMDIRMPGIDGVEATRRIREVWDGARVKIIVLTTFDQDANVLAALRAGANGFLSKGVGPAELADGIREVAGGGGALSAAAAAALIGHVAQEPGVVVDEALARTFDALTARERQIVVAVASGRSNEQIAADMYLSPFTVKTHANRAMTKVGARDRAQLVAYAYQAGLVT